MEILRKFRQEKHLTIKRVSEKIGVKDCTYCAYEHGRRRPSFEKLVILAQVFDCSVADFVDEKEGAQYGQKETHR